MECRSKKLNIAEIKICNGEEKMAFSEKLKNEIQLYCTNHLPPDSWYENEFSFIQDIELKNRIIAEFKAIRFAYKLY